MSALVEVRSFHGSPSPDQGTPIGSQTLRIKQADSDMGLAADVDGFLIPETITTPLYSYVKNFRVHVNSPVVRYVSNLEVFFRNRPNSWTGVEVFIRTNASYVDPEAQGTTPLAGFTNNAGQYTEDDPLLVAGLLTEGQSGDMGDWIQVQCKITDQCIPGMSLDFPFRVKWKEWS